MLLAAVFQLTPQTPAAIPVDQARAMESVFLEWVRALDPGYAAEMHAAQDKDFTIANLSGARSNRAREALLQSSTTLTWRITSFSPRLSTLVREKLLPGLPETIRLENSNCALKIERVSLNAEEHPDAALSSYAALAQNVLLGARTPESEIRVAFVSPTSFRQNNRQLLFPLPENAFDSWLRRWNAFAPVKLPDETRAFAAEAVAVNRYNLRTAKISGEGGWELGFSGACSYRILTADPYWLRVLHTLAAFSFFCGTGRKTAQGMGQTRVID